MPPSSSSASFPGLPALTRWCRRSVPAYLDDCGEVDVTALGLDCAREHGEEPGEHSLAWEAATTAADLWYDAQSARE
jgi:hypothetical protein